MNQEEIFNKILNKQSLTREEAVVVYGEEAVNEMDKQFELNTMTDKEQEEYTQYVFKEQIEQAEEIERLKKLAEETDIHKQLKNIELSIAKLHKDEITEKSPMILANLDTYYKDFLKYSEKYDPKSVSSFKNYNAAMKYLKYFTNENTILNFSFFKDIQSKLQLIPRNFSSSKRFLQYSFEEIVEINEIEDMDTLQNNTITNHMSFYNCFFEYLKYEQILKENPLDNIVPLPKLDSNKIEYSEEDLEKIFNSDMEQEYKDVCKLCLYTGLRIKELLSIKKENIQNGFIHITLENTSKKKHQRIIPIHKNIEKIIEHQIKHNQSAYLFFNFDQKNEVTNVGKRLNRRLHEIVLNQMIDGKEMRKSFHSLRKNFSQEIEMNTEAEEKTKKYLMGHTQKKDVTHEIYNRGKVNTKKLEDCINQITFKY